MADLFKGYVALRGKQCVQSLKSGDYLTLSEALECNGYGGVLAYDTILIDIDDFEQSELLMDIVESLQLRCKVVETTRGKHFYFSGYPSGTGCRTHCRLALGIDADIKTGSKLSYGVLKIDGKTRNVIYDVYSDEQYEPLPCWLRPVKFAPDFLELGEGDGRNQALFNYILTLQSSGFSKDEARETLDLINDNVLLNKLSKSELETVYRDQAFSKEVFYNKSTFLFDKFAEYLRTEHNIIKIGNQLHVYRNGVYVDGHGKIEHAMINHLPMLSKAKRSEVLAYLDVMIQDNAVPATADKIAFSNGVYDLANDAFSPFTPSLVITNLIDWDYDPSAYSELADRTLHKLACNDDEIYKLLEEVIGYTFYRRNELRKSFILIGDKANGKSTFLDMVKTLLGDWNTSALDLKELGDRFKTAELFGKLANIGDDIGDEFIPNPAIFKKLVSGDRINAERKGQDPFDFSPYAKLLFSANSMPRIKDKTGAVLDRMVLVPFNASFSKLDADFDPYIKYKLRTPEVMSHLINIGLKGLKRVLFNQSFTTPASVEKELEEYAVTNNPILDFFRDYEAKDIVDHDTGEIFEAYMGYAIANNIKPMSRNEFTRQVKQHYGLDSATKRVGKNRIRIFTEGLK